MYVMVELKFAYIVKNCAIEFIHSRLSIAYSQKRLATACISEDII